MTDFRRIAECLAECEGNVTGLKMFINNCTLQISAETS